MASEFTMNKKSNSRDRSYDSEFISIFESFRAAKNTPIKITIPQYVINSINHQGSIQNPLDLIFLKIG